MKFTRTSTAYKSDGTQAAAGVPRFETDGVMVEEGTVNLSADIATWSKLAPEITATLYANTYNGSNIMEVVKTVGTITYPWFRTTTTVLANTLYSFKFLVKMISGDISRIGYHIWGGNTTYVTTTPLGDGWYSVSITSSHPTATACYWGVYIIGSDSIDFLITRPSCEQKSYSTSFHPTTRSAESLTIPATALNASEGTIEFDCYITTNTKELTNAHDLFNCSNGVNSYNRFLFRHQNSGLWTLAMNNASGQSTNVNLADNVITTGKHRISVRYSTNQIAIFVDGVLAGYNNSPVLWAVPSTMQIGSYLGTSLHSNALFSNLRISSIARTDAELANTGALAVDEYTTYFAPLTSNLGAQGLGISVSSGDGATKQSRTGAGYHSMTAKAAVKSYLLRTAKSYQQINTAITGKALLSRMGRGYRTAAVKSNAGINIIEPSVEISTSVIERKGVTAVIERLSKTEVIGVPYIGDTVTLKAEFYTKGGLLADPLNISLKFYDSLKNQIGSAIAIGSQHRISAGVYEYDYTIPSGYSNIFYEFTATQEETPQLIPGRISCKQRVEI